MVMANSMIEDLISAEVEQQAQADQLRQKELEAAQQEHQLDCQEHL